MKKHRFTRTPAASAGVLAAEENAVREMEEMKRQQECKHKWKFHDADQCSYVDRCTECGILRRRYYEDDQK